MKVTATSSSRRYDFDWLRVLLILSVFVFHSLRIFDLEGWHVKNPDTYLGVQILIVFISRWLMPTIFIISGAATFYALGKRGTGSFIKDRALRLLVPLVVGIFTHVPVQGYLEAVGQQQYSGTFWQYYLSMFNGLLGFGGTFNWVGNHLWYLEMLFVFSLVLLPLLLWLRQGSGQRVLDWLGERLSAKGAIYLLALPTILILLTVDPDLSRLVTSDAWGGWSLLAHLVFFLTGFLLASSAGMQASIRRIRWVSLIAGIGVFAGGAPLAIALGEQAFGEPGYMALNLVSALGCWTWTLAIFGFGLEKLNARSQRLDYANDAVMPFYVMHQTVLVVVGYFVVGLAIPDLVKWLVIFTGSFVIIIGLYEFVVRRINLLRVLFGMKPVRSEVVVQKPAVQVS